MSTGTKFAILGVLLAVGLGMNGLRLMNQDGPLPHTDQHETYVGQRLAELVTAQTTPGQTVTVLLLIPRDVAPYQARVDKLIATLSADRQVNAVWAIEEGISDEDDYSSTIDTVLARHPESAALVVVSAGSVTHATVSESLQTFLADGGALILNGATRPDSAFVELAQANDATILARRVGWLRDAELTAPASESLSDYFHYNYTMLPTVD